MRQRSNVKRVWMAGVLTVIVAAGTQAGFRHSGRDSGEVIQPRTIHAAEPFTFAATGSVEGEVIEIKSASGEVVQRGRTDKLGRVFLAAGLPAGAYLISAVTSGSPQRMIVRPAPAIPPETQPMSVSATAQPINVREPYYLNGSGFSPNAADMTVNDTPVLAATSAEIGLGPNTQEPGIRELVVTNHQTGESVTSAPVLYYHLDGQLERRKLITGDQTALRLNFEPKNVPAIVQATVVDGPVSFGAGRMKSVVSLNDGAALLPVYADLGMSGPFTLAWTLIKASNPETPREWLQKKANDCAAASSLSENSQNKKDLAAEAELDGKLAKDDKNWDKDGKPKSTKKFAEFLNAEIKRLERIAKKEGNGGAKGKVADAIGDAYSAGSAAGLDLKRAK